MEISNFSVLHKITVGIICLSALVGNPALSSIKTLKESTVSVLSSTDGSGVIVAKKLNVYTVATAWHVISKNNSGEEIWIRTSDGLRHRINDSNITKLPDVDIAIIRFSSTRQYNALPISKNELPNSGMTAISAGWPLNSSSQSLKISLGKIIASSGVEIDNGYALLYTNRTYPGMSGGPVVNQKYELIGIHGRGEHNNQAGVNLIKTGINQGVPSYYLRQYLNKETVASFANELSTCGDYLAKANISVSHPGGANATLLLAKKAYTNCLDKSTPLFLMAHSYRRLGDLQKAIKLYEKSIALEGPSAATLSNLSAVRMELLLQGQEKVDLDITIRDLKEAYKLDPQNISVINNIAAFRMLTGDQKGAIETLKYGLTINHRDKVLLKNLKEWSR